MTTVSVTVATEEQEDVKELINSLKEDLVKLSNIISDLLVKLQPMAKEYEGYYLEYTWVLNKLKKKYCYYYLKSKTKHPRSKYLGSKPGDYQPKRQLKQYIRLLERLQRELQQLLVDLLNAQKHIDFIMFLINTAGAKQ